MTKALKPVLTPQTEIPGGGTIATGTGTVSGIIPSQNTSTVKSVGAHTPSIDSVHKIDLVQGSTGGAGGSDRGGDRGGEREREGVEVRDLTAVFASCDTHGHGQPDTTLPQNGTDSLTVSPRVKPVIPMLSFTPFLSLDPTTTQVIPKIPEVNVTRIDSVISPTSVVHPPPTVSPTPPLTTTPTPQPAYPSCFVGAPRRGSLTRYTQLCNKMEPLIENVLERMDSTGNLLDLDGEMKTRRLQISNKFIKLSKANEEEEEEENEEEEVDEKVRSGTSSQVISSLLLLSRDNENIENNVEGGIPFSTNKKIYGNNLLKNNPTDLDNVNQFINVTNDNSIPETEMETTETEISLNTAPILDSKHDKNGDEIIIEKIIVDHIEIDKTDEFTNNKLISGKEVVEVENEVVNTETNSNSQNSEMKSKIISNGDGLSKSNSHADQRNEKNNHGILDSGIVSEVPPTNKISFEGPVVTEYDTHNLVAQINIDSESGLRPGSGDRKSVV